MMINSLKDQKEVILEAVEKYRSICILTHKNPDGDGLCTALFLQEILRNKSIKSDIVLEEQAPDVYDFLDGQKRTKVFSNHMFYDLLIILDCHEEERIGVCSPLIHTAKKIITVDHHIERASIPDSTNYIDTKTVSVGAILYKMFEKEMNDFPAESALYCAKAVYTSIINDTDNFVNANTDAETFLICSKLMKYGIKPGDITEHFLLSKPANELKFVGESLSTIETYENGKVLFMHSTQDMLNRNGLNGRETSKLTRWTKGTKGVQVVVSMQEVKPNRYRMSLRSNFIDVNKIAVKYGGGGHEKASGCEIKGSLEELQNMLLKDIREQL
ncbi:MAG: bifunctional oligoribonuclease/PAP phosphatase NrnA [Candidatus Cloacimonadales bacterium]|nr:bifunctional oligoribonuclease/PAP phosphatase NrnA [Candidatus Cloacimonadales bacterium]